MARCFGLDLGRTCGWTDARPPYLVRWAPRTRLEGPRPSNQGLTCGEWELGKHASWDRLYRALWVRLDEQHAEMPIDVLAFESAGTHFKTEAALMIVLGLVVVCMTWASVNDVDPHPVHNQRMKKHATGHGHAEKDLIMAAAESLGWAPKTENEGDSLFVVDYCLTERHRRASY